jgi:hypothetical protein
MTVTRTFLAWHRAGLATALTGAPAAGLARAAAPATVTLRGTDRSTSVPVELAGPGDIRGLDPQEVRRTEPHDGSADFEPSCLAYVELRSPDLPWRFSPVGPLTEPLADPEDASAARSRRRLQPWLALVVVPQDNATLERAAPGELSTLRCPAAELPDPAETWAWAHVQVSTADGEDPADAIDDPRRSVARLVCPRRLEEDTPYLACLVPTFAAGRLGAGAGGEPLAPAWGADTDAELPAYYSFAFATTAAGTFERLARRLRPRPAPQASSGRGIATDAPGWGATGTPGASTLMQGALRPVAGPAPGPAADEPPPDSQLAAELAAAVSASGGGFELRPPIYGQDYAGGVTAVPAEAPGWLAQLNTDPRRRLAAGMAAWAVAVDQEELSDRAWGQLAAAGLSPASAADPQLAAEVGGALAVRDAADGVGLTLRRLLRPGGPFAARGAAAPVPAARAAAAIDPPPPAPRFTPTFDEPAYTLLRATADEWLLPGSDEVPDDSVVLLRTNPAFAEAFLVGLNHALTRELAWRGFPLASSGTLFRRFWSASAGAPDPALPPLAGWEPDSALGAHSPAADQLVLLIRGQLVRRFPTAAIFLSRTAGDGSELQLRPTLAATLGPGSTFYGFPLTPEQALHPPPDGGAATWSVVIQESVQHARFGCDEPADGGPAALAGWQDLDWSHPHVRDATHIPVAGPLAGVSRPLTAAPSPVASPSATWGLDAAQQAAILQQPAFRVRIPVGLWLPEAEA